MLVGREHERASIDDLLDGARDGQSGVLLIRGAVGVGKTALLDYAVDCARNDVAVLRSREVEPDAELAFSGLWDLFGPVLDRLDRIPTQQADALAGALAIGPPVHVDPFTICAATLSLLAAAAEDGPLLCVVDDAHWLDPSSAQALSFAVRRLEAEGIAVLLAVREGEPTGFDLLDLPELALAGLSKEAGKELLARTGKREPAPEVCEQLVEATGGNPLALLEVASSLTEEQLSGTEPLGETVPVSRTLEEAFGRQIEKLPEDTREALLVAASSGSIQVEVIGQALSSLQLELAALAAAEEAGLVTLANGTVEFRHPVVRSVVYHQAPATARRAAHEALAKAESGELADDRRALHLAAAAPSPDSELAAALEQTARKVRERGGHAEAATALARAAQLTTEDEERARRLGEAAIEARLAGQTEQALSLLNEALTATDDELLRARIQHLRGVIEMWQGQPRTAHDELVAEAARIEPADPGKAARMLTDAGWACFMAGEISDGVATAEKAVSLSRKAGDVSEVLANAVLGIGLLLGGNSERAGPLLDRYEPLLGEADFIQHNYEFVWPAGQVLTWLERYERARKVFTGVIETARAKSAPSMLPYALAGLAELDLRTGGLATAYANAVEASRMAKETEQPAALCFTLVTLARIEAAQGRSSECRDHVAEALELATSKVDAVVGYAGATLGFLELALGNNEDAIQHLEAVAVQTRERGLEEPSVIQWAPDLIEAYIRGGRPDDARSALEAFELQAKKAQRAWALAAAARCRGLLAEDDRFEAEFLEALRWHDLLRTPFERARTELCFGEKLRRARQRTEAREHLRSALEELERLGAAPWAERARTELRASGETLRPREEAKSDELTPQELRVALTVAAGATNREAGAALFLSPKTIEAHLGRIYRKLGVRSRTELTHRLATQGLLAEHESE